MTRPRFSIDAKREFAAQMRQKPTLAERALWYRLQKKQTGFVFHRQSAQRGYILDFYCPKLRLAIEVDGSIHDLPGHAEADAKKERVLSDRGIKVLRFTNQDVLDFPSVVMARIETALRAFAPCTDDGGRQKVDRSSSRPCASVEKKVSSAPADTSAVDDQGKIPASAADFEELLAASRKLERLDRLRAFAFEDRSMAERAFDQKYRLEQWLKKRQGTAAALCATEPQALVLKGMEVKQA